MSAADRFFDLNWLGAHPAYWLALAGTLFLAGCSL